MKNLLLALALAVTVATTARAAVTSYDFNSINAVIPDGNVTGWSDTRLIEDLDGEYVHDVNVRINITGGYNGDLYGYLVHSTGFAVLLNRTGKTSGDAFGYGHTGFDVTIDDDATTYNNDIHLYASLSTTPTPTYSGGGQLEGSWLEDGRNANPATVTDGSSRNALLNSFENTLANGTWTLFLADFANGDESMLVSWGLDIDSELTPVPEPVTWALVGFGLVFGAVQFRRLLRTRLT